MVYKIYTDGSTKGNGQASNSGGWAYVITNNDIVIHKSFGSAGGTTNQKMELTACIRALEYYNEHFVAPENKCSICSDSAYLINCYSQKWWINWEKNGWRNAKGEAVANKELWEQIIPYFRRSDCSFHKVKGHSNDRFNNFADKLAQAAAEGTSISRVYQITEGFI